MNLAAHERKKYEKAWAMPEYHKFSPGVEMLPLFKQMVKRIGHPSLLDIGCGAGAASIELKKLGYRVTAMDHVDVKERPKGIKFIKQNLWTPWKVPAKGVVWDRGYCCDVMEHIPSEKVDAVLKNIMQNCYRTFFSISFMKDHFGEKVGHPLHLTVKPFVWWRDKLGEFGTVKNARDLLGMGVFDVSA